MLYTRVLLTFRADLRNHLKYRCLGYYFAQCLEKIKSISERIEYGVVLSLIIVCNCIPTYKTLIRNKSVCCRVLFWIVLFDCFFYLFADYINQRFLCSMCTCRSHCWSVSTIWACTHMYHGFDIHFWLAHSL